MKFSTRRFALFFLTFLYYNGLLFSQTPDSSLLYRHWVCISEHWQNTRVYVPRGSERAEKIDLSEKFGGITFKENHVLIRHIWKRCGNDYSPNYEEGTWSLHEKKGVWILSITGINLAVGNYEVISIKEEEIILEILN